MAALFAGLLALVLVLVSLAARVVWQSREDGFARELGGMREARDRAQERADQLESAIDTLRGRSLDVGIPARRDAGEAVSTPLPTEVESFIAGLEGQEEREEFRESARMLANATPGMSGTNILAELIS